MTDEEHEKVKLRNEQLDGCIERVKSAIDYMQGARLKVGELKFQHVIAGDLFTVTIEGSAVGHLGRGCPE